MPKAKSISPPLSDDAIRHRAYLLWEADGRPDGMADHYWIKASEVAPDVSAKPRVKATASKTAVAMKAGKPGSKPSTKTLSPAEIAPPKAAKAKPAPAEKAPKLKAAAAKVAAPAVKVKPAAKAPVKSATKKAPKKA